MRNAALEQEFEKIRFLFFPRWDRKRQWRVKLVSDLDGALGLCEREQYTIYLTFVPKNDKERAVLIHEICHAVTNDYHGRKWFSRMVKAVERARELGFENLAKELLDDVKIYGFRLEYDMEMEEEIMTRRKVYNKIRDVARDCPDLTFGQIVDFVRSFCQMSLKQFFKRFPKARVAYIRGKEEAHVSSMGQSCMRPKALCERSSLPSLARETLCIDRIGKRGRPARNHIGPKQR